MAKLILTEGIQKGDRVVDATLGNGYDAAFLRDLVGAEGLVYAMDIQASAIEAAKNTIPKEKQENIKFILDGHENLDQHVEGRVQAVVFNLGYLPASDHVVKTGWPTTRIAIEKSMELLEKQGLICVSAYLGHDEGAEYRALHEFFAQLDAKRFKVIEINPLNQNKHAPKLLVCQKIL